MLATVLRVLTAGAAFTVVQALASSLVSALLGPADVTLPPDALGWVVLSNVLTAGVLAWMALRSSASGSRLAVFLAVVLFVIATLNNLIEAVFFRVITPGAFARYGLQGALAAVGSCFLLVAILGRRRAGGSASPPAAAVAAAPRAWRLAAADLLYVGCYFAAGAVIYPWVREFYEGRGLPAPALVAAMQLFVRGPVFVGFTLLVVRMVDGERWEKAVVAGATFSVIGGVAPLLIPNPYFPDAVRWAHFFEVGLSNFIFGATAAWLLLPPPRRLAALARSSA